MEVRMEPPQDLHTHTIINLHGRDSIALRYCDEFLESHNTAGQNVLKAVPGVKWVFPQAPIIRSERFKMELSQWFDMWSTENPNERWEEQALQLEESVSLIAELVLDEAKIIGLENIILFGISQGAAVALATLLKLGHTMCAFVAFSSWKTGCVPLNTFRRSLKTPMFIAHCEDDDTIDIKYGRALKSDLEYSGASVEFHSYAEGGHWFNEPQGIDDLIEFLRKVTR